MAWGSLVLRGHWALMVPYRFMQCITSPHFRLTPWTPRHINSQGSVIVADSGIRGLRHLALKVTDLARSRKFYEEFFGMQVVWEPDPENVYLSSGRDNLALHLIPQR